MINGPQIENDLALKIIFANLLFYYNFRVVSRCLSSSSLSRNSTGSYFVDNGRRLG